MSTNSTIMAKLGSEYHAIYCHSDGYLSWVGARLLQHYNTPQQVAALIALGDLSQLGTEIGRKHDFDWLTKEYLGADFALIRSDHRYNWCVAYHRDRGDALPSYQCKTWRKAASTFNAPFTYVHHTGKWFVSLNQTTLHDLKFAVDLDAADTLAKENPPPPEPEEVVAHPDLFFTVKTPTFGQRPPRKIIP